ncbi:HesA/MoeB/ThiF family protein [Niabella ginsengisoli]|uniref:HesA/MoeB/ThiF family protein n=2 Tax=Niabella ginsengisoli TaxID=522298 RepID=A0ABS9SJN4_9BACT|nr:HesA/MoeB/ThiF family protein [Niabella ginsengisoli]
MLKGFGIAAQQKLLAARVLVVGAGGLGCPVLQYLCAAGVGTIGVIDDDVVSLSNLHRQVLFGTDDIGKPKVEVAVEQLRRLNPEVTINIYTQRLTVDNTLELLGKYDLVVDGSDNFATRYLVNDACVLLDKPLVYGAVSTYEGQLAVFNWNKNSEQERAVNYRDVFPQPPSAQEVPNCNEAGVLGVLPGIIGTMMATEVIKIVSEIGEVLAGKLLIYNSLNHNSYRLSIEQNSEANDLIPKSTAAFKRMIYEETCISNIEIDAAAFNEWVRNDNALIIDVRDSDEMPIVSGFKHINIPYGEILERGEELDSENIILFCLSGKRSFSAAQKLKQLRKGVNVYSLKGGIESRGS